MSTTHIESQSVGSRCSSKYLPVRGIRLRVFGKSVTAGLLACALALAGISCEGNDLGTVDFTGLPPLLSAGVITPDSINVDLLQPNNNLYSVTVTIRATVSDPDGPQTISSVTAEVFRPRASSRLLQVQLRDNGIAPDVTAGDLEYAADVTFTLNRSQTGVHRIQLTARDRSNLRSTTLEFPLVLTRNNAPPVLDANSLVAPDTLTRPTTGSSTFFISIAASDPDGLADIEEVYLLNLQTQNRTFLLDDGGVQQPGGISSGDLLAGDGIFSVTLQLPSTISPGAYPFLLQATDSFRDTSNSVPYTLIVE